MNHAEHPDHDTTGLAEVLGDIARTLQSEPDLDATLAATVKAAVDHVDDAEHAGISLAERQGKIRTVAPTDELVAEIVKLQYRTHNLGAETRWPRFAPAAANTGVRSIALVGAQTEANLHVALHHRDVIGMAKGILVQRHDVDSTRSFRMLVEASQHGNMKLHQVAEWLVEHRHDL
jgi:hypothetical protein